MSIKNNFTIVIVTFKSEKVIETCLNSIDQKYTIIIVENSSNVNFKKKIYLMRFSGLYNSIIRKKSWYRAKIK